MFSRIIELSASKQEFRFVDGAKEIRFRPVVFLAPDQKKIIAIGEPPAGSSGSEGIHVFDDADGGTLPLLGAMIRYGLRSISGAVRFRPIVLKISVGSDIRAQLKGSTWVVFQHAAAHAGVTKVIE